MRRKPLILVALVAALLALCAVTAWAEPPPEVPQPPPALGWLAAIILWVPTTGTLASILLYAAKVVAVVQVAKRVSDWILAADWLTDMFPKAEPYLDKLRHWAPVVYSTVLHVAALLPLVLADGLSVWGVIVLAGAILGTDLFYGLLRDGEIGLFGARVKLPSWLAKLLTLFPKR